MFLLHYSLSVVQYVFKDWRNYVIFSCDCGRKALISSGGSSKRKTFLPLYKLFTFFIVANFARESFLVSVVPEKSMFPDIHKLYSAALIIWSFDSDSSDPFQWWYRTRSISWKYAHCLIVTSSFTQLWNDNWYHNYLKMLCASSVHRQIYYVLVRWYFYACTNQ